MSLRTRFHPAFECIESAVLWQDQKFHFAYVIANVVIVAIIASLRSRKPNINETNTPVCCSYHFDLIFANTVALKVMFTLIIHADVGILRHPPKIPCYFSCLKYHRIMSYTIPNTDINCIQYCTHCSNRTGLNKSLTVINAL